MTETPEENRKSLKYEIGATVRPDRNPPVGYSYWPNGMLALSIWSQHATIFNSIGASIAKWKVKSWK